MLLKLFVDQNVEGITTSIKISKGSQGYSGKIMWEQGFPLLQSHIHKMKNADFSLGIIVVNCCTFKILL